MNEYKRFIATWELIRELNRARIFTYGYATHGDGGPVIYFDTPEQKRKYQAIFN